MKLISSIRFLRAVSALCFTMVPACVEGEGSPPRSGIVAGTICYAAGHEDGWTIAGTSRATLERWEQLLRANDTVGTRQMLDSQDVVRITRGTRVVLVEVGDFCEVRFEDGSLTGQKRWVDRGFLVLDKPSEFRIDPSAPVRTEYDSSAPSVRKLGG
ncbi:MAG: hypothetical protein IPN34_16765 [Planctomycetes bacterium]|nr:hypothetical protein [Planctomycetota bacterium]